jgi:hypothetical protein
MAVHVHQSRANNKGAVLACVVLVGAMLAARPTSAQTYLSAEPIPGAQIVGKENLAKIEGVGYSNLAVWSQRLLYDCGIVQNVIFTLSNNQAISTIRPSNTSYRVAAGGFEGVTDPSYVFRIEDSGPAPASASDIFVLDNALGYALNQGGTAQFGLSFDPTNPYTSALAYAVVTFQGPLTGEEARNFFNHLGAIDKKLWTGKNAGFTQIALEDSDLSNSLLFLIGSVSTGEFTNGIYQAVVTTAGAMYSPLVNGAPTTATAGAAFPGNNWISRPGGEGYLSKLVNPAPQLLNQLAALRQKHLEAVSDLLQAINNNNVLNYLGDQFKCP